MGIVKSSIKLVILAVVMNYVFRWCVENGIGLHFNNVNPGSCRVVPGIKCGSEKISVTKNGIAFITSGFRRMTNCDKRYIQGGIYLFDFNNPNSNTTKLEIEGDIDLKAFEPHGMDILEQDENVLHLYVVNHANHVETVEIFQYLFDNPTQLKHVKTLRHKLFVCLNDIAIVDEEIFYVTNYIKYCNSKLPLALEFEYIFGLKTANIVYYNKGEASVMIDNGSMFNGITLSTDRKKVFTVLSKSHLLYVFERNLNNGGLLKKSEHDVKFAPDNVFLDKETDNLFIGAMKSFSCIMMLTSNMTSHCSATGIKVSPKSLDWNEVSVEEVLHLDGKDYVSLSSSFVHYKGHYLSGTVFENLGYCKARCIS